MQAVCTLPTQPSPAQPSPAQPAQPSLASQNLTHLMHLHPAAAPRRSLRVRPLQHLWLQLRRWLPQGFQAQAAPAQADLSCSATCYLAVGTARPLRSTQPPRFGCTFPPKPTHSAVFLLHLSPINQSMNQSHVPATQHSPLLPYLSPVDLPPSSFLRRLFPSAQLCYLYSCPCPAQLSGMYADTLLCCWLFSALLTAALHFRCGLTSTAMLVKFVGVIIIISKMISHEMKSGWGALG